MLRFRFAFLVLVVCILGAPTLTYAQDFTATLNGYQESPSISTDASGNFTADLDETTNEISYTLSYDGIATPVAFAHWARSS